MGLSVVFFDNFFPLILFEKMIFFEQKIEKFFWKKYYLKKNDFFLKTYKTRF